MSNLATVPNATPMELVAALQARAQRSVERLGGYPDEVEFVTGPAIVIAGGSSGGDCEATLKVIPIVGAMKKFLKAKRLVQRWKRMGDERALAADGTRATDDAEDEVGNTMLDDALDEVGL